MIISASRRTDIPAIYSDWFFNRIKEGYVMVRNPMNLHSVYTLSLKRDVVDCIVFWTKNPARMLDNLDIINGYNYYFQFTLNPYDTGIEANVPKKAEIIDTFKKLSSKIGKNKVIWRYDPILVNDSISIEYHIKYFEILASKLSGYTDKCIISFLDFYKKAERNLKELKVRDITQEEKKYIAANLSKIAESYNLQLETCAEEIDLSELGIKHARCIDPDLIESITGEKLNIKKDKGQREACGCAASIDIGAYNTCPNGCLYCYANFNKEMTRRNMQLHIPASPLLFGEIGKEDKITERKVDSCIRAQGTIFD